MRKWRKRLASVLAATMLVSLLPVSALAGKIEGGPPEDEVIYNLGTLEVTVGTDEEKLQTSPIPYDIFDEDGNYTLQLEPDAFFPYEVQFTYAGDTWSEWFMDADDTVEVGGHVFSVASSVSDPMTLTGLEFEIGGQSIIVWPEEKEFTNDSLSISPMSLLPLKEKRLYLDMRGYLPDELKTVGVSSIFSGSDGSPVLADDDMVVWTKGYNNDDYTIIGSNGTVDLSPEYRSSSTVFLEMIVGTADQFDINNVRYLVQVYVTPVDDLLSVSAYTTDDVREEITVLNTYYWERNSNQTIFEIGVDDKNWEEGQQAYLSIDLKDEIKNRGITAVAYEGYYHSEEEAETDGAAIIEDLLDQTDIATTGGHLDDYSYQKNYEGMPEVTLVLKREDAVVFVQPMILYMYPNQASLSLEGIYEDTISYYSVSDGSPKYTWDDETGVSAEIVTLKEGFVADETYYARLELHDSANPDAESSITRAVEGYYDTKDEVLAEKDIKDELFGDGYGADYSQGVVFSVLYDDEIYQLKIITEEAEAKLPGAPTPDSQDTYFRVERAWDGEGNSLEYYVMPYEHDGYYYRGYQTVFLLDQSGPVIDETIIPVFFSGSGVTVYAGHDRVSGDVQKSGITEIPFESGTTIPYSAAAESAGHLKNYWVTFVTQQTGGPKLFVNAANDPDRIDEETNLPVREVYLTEEFNYHQDVFFANIGDQEMSGIYVKLEEAQNVDLDAYWKVQEDSVGALSAFSSTDTRDSDGRWVSYGELSNVAKIRLVPVTMEDGSISSGDVSGILVIGYDANKDGTPEEEVRIKLTGTAGMPKITTDTIRDGVKYVPYSSVIQTNSMEASDAVKFSSTGGSLPDGITLKQNGVLYGVPKVAGTFPFTVTATYGASESLSVTKSFTMTILDNTNANVENSNMDTWGYPIEQSIPYNITVSDNNGQYEYQDQVFISVGEYNEFMDFYIDGNKLTKNLDYVAEEGSTKITIRAQTFQTYGSGTHTIASEFQTVKGDISTVKSTAQNYTMTITGGSSPGNSGGGSTESSPNYEVNTPTRTDHGKITVRPEWAQQGDKVTITTQPDAGYELSKLTVTDKKGNEVALKDLGGGKYTFTMPASRVNIQAIFERIPSPIDEFIDVSANAYYAQAVIWAVQNGITSGTSDVTFSPDLPCTRAQIVTFLWREAGSPAPKSTENPFEDLSSDAYYYEAMLWAVENGITGGTTATTCEPDMPCPRAQAITLLWRATGSPMVNGNSDFHDVSADAYYASAVAWAERSGITDGVGNGAFGVNEVCSRAQIMMFLYQNAQLK